MVGRCRPPVSSGRQLRPELLCVTPVREEHSFARVVWPQEYMSGGSLKLKILQQMLAPDQVGAPSAAIKHCSVFTPESCDGIRRLQDVVPGRVIGRTHLY